MLQYMLLYLYMLEYKPTYNIYRTAWSPEKKRKKKQQLSISGHDESIPRGATSRRQVMESEDFLDHFRYGNIFKTAMYSF